MDPKSLAKLCLHEFNSLPKTGKPKSNEWTTLSCIVQQSNSSFEVVSLGTGSKCIGKSKMCPKGTILNDSHAEVMCRRGFLRYLYSQLNETSIFTKVSGKWVLKPEVEFHFFTTHVPCGDATIFPKEIKVEEPPDKRMRMDVFRTGAKCVGDLEDPKEEGVGYHIVGVVRTKPGRGDSTLSVSCSDKLSKWAHLGIQGALLTKFLNPIYLSTFTMSDDAPFCRDALNRALYDRLGDITLNSPYRRQKMDIFRVPVDFDYKKTHDKIACPASIAWYKEGSTKILEVAVNGRKQGVTKKNVSSEKGRLKICKLEIFRKFFEHCGDQSGDLTYLDAKWSCEEYQTNWEVLRTKFGKWTNKDRALLKFSNKNHS